MNPRITFFHWVARGQRITAGVEAKIVLDRPTISPGPPLLSGWVFIGYDFTGGRGVRDFAPRDTLFRDRMEEGSGRIEAGRDRARLGLGGGAVSAARPPRPDLAGKSSRSHLPDLEARLRASAVHRIAARAEAELGYEVPRSGALLAALLRIADLRARLRCRDSKRRAPRSSSLTRAPRRKESVARYLVEFLRAHAEDPLTFRATLRAVKKRWLDLSAVRRISVQKSDRIDEVDVVYRAACDLARKSPPHEVVVVLEDVARIPTIVAHAEPDKRDAVRTGALRAVAALLRAAGPGSVLRHLGVTAARKVVPLGARRRRDPLGAGSSTRASCARFLRRDTLARA